MRHNDPDTPPRRQQLVTLIEQLRTVERLLTQPGGTTVYEMAETVGKSEKQARRYIKALKSLGVPVTDDYERGDDQPSIG